MISTSEVKQRELGMICTRLIKRREPGLISTRLKKPERARIDKYMT